MTTDRTVTAAAVAVLLLAAVGAAAQDSPEERLIAAIERLEAAVTALTERIDRLDSAESVSPEYPSVAEQVPFDLPRDPCETLVCGPGQIKLPAPYCECIPWNPVRDKCEAEVGDFPIRRPFGSYLPTIPLTTLEKALVDSWTKRVDDCIRAAEVETPQP